MALDINNNNKTINDSPDNTDNATKKIRESVDLMHQQPQVEELSISSLDKKMQENSIDMQDDSQLVNKTTSPSSLLSAVVQSVHNQEAIEALLKRTGYPLRQENGQRKYGPPPNWDPSVPEPGRACEIFIGKIPRDCFEDEIVPLLERIGHLYEFRLMMEYSGYNRGYGFAMFTNREDAKKAVAELNNYEIRKGRMIGICSSVDNCRLFVGGIPKSKTKEEILEEMRKVTEDVVNVIVYPSAHDKTKNRGFAFVQYTNHRAAAIARRKLIPNRIQLFGQPIAVDWAEPEPEVDEDVMATVKVLYVRNLMLSTTEEQIKAEFEKIKEGMVERVKKMKDFAFVHFKEREDALRCMHIMNGATIDGAIVEVSLSKPVDKSAMTRLIRATPSPTSHLLTNAAAIMAVTTGNPSSASAPLITIPFPTMAALTAPIDTSATVPQTSNGGTNTPPTALTIQPATAFTPFQPQSLLTTVSSAANQTSQSYQVPAQFLTSSVSFPAELLTQATHSPQQPSSHLLVKGHRSSRGISSSRVGQGYKYYLKGVAGTVKKQASSQDIPYDLYSGMNPVPVLPFNPFQSYSNKSSNQILEEICLKEGFGMPSYTLHTTNGTDQDGREIGLYMYKITVPGLFQGKPVASNKLMRTIDEAKIDAADFLLSQICPQPAFIDLNEYYAAAATQTPTPTQPNTQLPLVYQAPADLVAHQHLQTQQQRNSIPSAPNSGPADGFYGSQASNPANPLIQPQYLVDATGQYIVCQPSLWQ